MEPRPKIKIEYTATDKFLEISVLFTLVFLWAVTIFFYSNLPDIIPTYFDGSGLADDHDDKMIIFFLPVLASILFIGLSVLNKYPHIFNYPTEITTNNVDRQYQNATSMIRCLKLVIATVFTILAFMIYCTSKERSAINNSWLLVLILGLILTPLIFFTIKALKIK